MNKQEIKNILISMRTNQNEVLVNNLLGKIDMMDEKQIQNACEKLGNNQKNIRNFFQDELSKKQRNQNDEKFPINDMFTYGISGSCIHLHLPIDLHEMLAKIGISKTIDTVNLNLLDAIDKINKLKNDGFYRFQEQDSIYMISPALVGKEMKFLEDMDFETRSYKKSNLNDNKFIQEHPESKLAIHIFGTDKNIGTASINFDTINSKEWQDKKNKKIEEFNKKGISLNQSSLSDNVI